MTITNDLAKAARAVINAREAVPNPPPIDAHLWRAVVAEARELDHKGDDARAAAVIDAWVVAELDRLATAEEAA